MSNETCQRWRVIRRKNIYIRENWIHFSSYSNWVLLSTLLYLAADVWASGSSRLRNRRLDLKSEGDVGQKINCLRLTTEWTPSIVSVCNPPPHSTCRSATVSGSECSTRRLIFILNNYGVVRLDQNTAAQQCVEETLWKQLTHIPKAFVNADKLRDDGTVGTTAHFLFTIETNAEIEKRNIYQLTEVSFLIR